MRTATIAPVSAASAAIHAVHPRTGRARWRGVSMTSVQRSEAVADARLGNDQGRTYGVALDLPAQVGDVNTQVRLRVAAAAPPHCAEDLLVGERLPRVCHEGA